MDGYCYKYPHPAVTADCVIFRTEGGNLSVLLVRRANEPFKDRWALPGGFMNIDETAEECARRELKEETGIEVGRLEQFLVSSSVHRDPRERVVSIAFMAFVQACVAEGGDDAAEARWFPVDRLPELAFDHAAILSEAVSRAHCRPEARVCHPEAYIGIIGAVAGDIAGSVFEWKNTKSTDFSLFSPGCTFTDDTVMTIAVADWLSNGGDLAAVMRRWGARYPDRGYGGMFYCWLFSGNPERQRPYNSFGNGAGMRVSPCGFLSRSLNETLYLAEKSAEVTHNHPEGIKGAQAIAASVFLARTGVSKENIREYVEKTFGYDLHRTCDEIRPDYSFDETCPGSCPEAIIAFLDSTSYESAVRLAISLGGDSDTIACMAGGIAAAYYGVPEWIVSRTLSMLPRDMTDILRSAGAPHTENNEGNGN